MATRKSPEAGTGNSWSRTLSTGHTVELPLETEATVLGAVFSAPKKALAELLPDGLSPLRATTTGKGAITFLSVEYRRIDVEGMEPYNEFSVIIPATHMSSSAIPYLSALIHGTDGYVWYLPVTTDPARALGVDIWGFPKVVADITHEDNGSTRTTTVTEDGELFISFEIDRPPTIGTQGSGFTYTVSDGELLKVPNEVDAESGLWPLSRCVSVTFGDHPRTAPLQSLNLSKRALARVSIDGDVRFYPAEPV